MGILQELRIRCGDTIRRKMNRHGGPFGKLTFNRYARTMQLRKASGQGKSQPGPFVGNRAIKA